MTDADSFRVTPETPILFDTGDEEGERIAHFLAGLIGNSRETTPIVSAASDPIPDGSIYLTSRGADASLGPEGYTLSIRPNGVRLWAAESAGIFYGVQTIRQLLPELVEYTAAYPNPLVLPAVEISDSPRFAWRGAMLDVARHFFEPRDVRRYIDLMALYKLNRLHLHLSDDQGWRIEIASWPNLTALGGSTEVGGGEGGFYTADEYAGLVRYAADRFITIVPEIDMPGHTNAALASYSELNCDGVAPALYTGTEVGFSSLCTDKEVVFTFVDDMVREISALTPGPYFHVGGDEVQTLAEEQYVEFIARVQQIVASHGKRMVGWDEVASAALPAGSIVQLWRPLWSAGATSEPDSARDASAAALRAGVDRAVASGSTVILSPADRFYLDMKYEPSTILGLSWAGYADTRRSYDWRITDTFAGIPERAIEGVEAPIWTETLGTMADVEYMAFPRLVGVAELGWSQGVNRNWRDYQARITAHERRWMILGVNYGE
jgi:hexosaminidase